MTEDELKAIADRANAATPGLLIHAKLTQYGIGVVSDFVVPVDDFDFDVAVCERSEDAELFSYARADILALIAEVRRQAQEIEALKHSKKIHPDS